MKKPFLLLAVALILGALFDYLFFKHSLGISFPLYIFVVILVLFGLSHHFQLKISGAAGILAIAGLFFASMVMVRASEFLMFLNIAISLFLLLLLTRTLIFPHIRSYRIITYVKTLFVLPMEYIAGFFRGIFSLPFPAIRGSIKNYQRITHIFRGVLLAIPFLILFILLFSSADFIFARGIKNIFDFKISFETCIRIGIILLFTAGFFGTFWFLFIREHGKEDILEPNAKHALKTIETSILFSSLNVLFLTFIIVQLRYLFGGASNISIEGLTYAEYAHRGFFELITVACISLLLILVMEKYAERKENGHFTAFKFLTGALVIQVLVIMASAYKRLSLYEAAYGFTTLRLYSHLFIVFIGVIFLLLLYKILIDRRESVLVFHTLITGLAVLALINLANPDAFIARKNILRYQETGKIDVDYLAGLSDDAIEELRKIPQIPESRFQKQKRTDWQSMRF